MGWHGSGWRAYIRYDEQQDRPEISRDLLRRVATFASPYWGQAALLILLITLTSLLGLVPPLLLRDLIDNALPSRDVARLNWLALGLLAVPLLTQGLGVMQAYLASSVGEGLICDLRRSLYDHLQRMSLRFFTHTKTGEMMSRLNNDVGGAQRAVTGTLVSMATNIISLITTLAIMISLDWRLTLLGVSILPLFIWPSRRVGRLLRKVTRRQMEYNATMNAQMNETLNVSGALLVKIFGRERDEVERFRQDAERVRDIGIRRALIGRWFRMGIGLVGAIGTALVFWIGGHMVLRGAFTIGTIVAFSSYLRQVYQPLTALSNARVEFVTSMVSFERVFEVLDLPVEIRDKPEAVALSQPRGHVRFDDVSFTYMEQEQEETVALDEVQRFGRHGVRMDVTKSGQLASGRGWAGRPSADDPGSAGDHEPAPGQETTPESEPAPGPRWALQDLSFEIQPGQLAALVGPSGAGKTTVTYLLPRLYDPTEGRILLDGHDLRDIRLTSLAGAIGVVTQETYLFHDTVQANLRYAKPEATLAEMETACRAANIHEFIAQLPEGYETIVGERGYRLSGGEKQRVAMARVILKDPRVLILDEATSHLDSESEALIQQALQYVMQGRTSLVIAHRLSTILAADVILVLDQGRLVQQGTHKDLLAQGGLYRQLYERQFASLPAEGLAEGARDLQAYVEVGLPQRRRASRSA
jgi:ATP-binding cassette subfamily B protein